MDHPHLQNSIINRWKDVAEESPQCTVTLYCSIFCIALHFEVLQSALSCNFLYWAFLCFTVHQNINSEYHSLRCLVPYFNSNLFVVIPLEVYIILKKRTTVIALYWTWMFDVWMQGLMRQNIDVSPVLFVQLCFEVFVQLCHGQHFFEGKNASSCHSPCFSEELSLSTYFTLSSEGNFPAIYFALLYCQNALSTKFCNGHKEKSMHIWLLNSWFHRFCSICKFLLVCALKNTEHQYTIDALA